MKRIMVMFLLFALTCPTVLGCATTGKDADRKSGPAGSEGQPAGEAGGGGSPAAPDRPWGQPEGEGGWENPNM
jgi:hypothetical protein